MYLKSILLLVALCEALMFWAGLLGLVPKSPWHLAGAALAFVLTGPRVMRRVWAWAIGSGFVIVGVLRFVAIASVADLREPQPFHGVVHLVSGAIFLWLARQGEARLQRGERWLGVFYLAFFAVGLAGFVNYGDRYAHLIVALVSLALGAEAKERAPIRKSLNLALWIAQILLAFTFAMAASRHLLPGHLPAWTQTMPLALVHFIGICELCGAIGVVLPEATRMYSWLTSLAASGLAAIMLLACAFHWQRGETKALPLLLSLAASAIFVAWGRRGASAPPPEQDPQRE